MDKIKTVKIKNQDGTVSEESYSISVDATNVDMSNGKDLQDTIGNIDIDIDGNIANQLNNLNNNVNNLNNDIKKKVYYFDTVENMKNAKLKDGDFVITLGYYKINDGGGAEYKIINNSNNYYEMLSNNLKAELIIKDYAIPEQFGAKGDGVTDDTIALQNAINSKKTVLLRGATYIITDALVINSNSCSIVGDYKKTYIKQNGNNHGFILKNILKGYISNLILFSINNNNEKRGIYIEDCQDCIIENVFIEGFDIGIKAFGTEKGKMANCFFNNVNVRSFKNYGVDISTAADLYFTNIYITAYSNNSNTAIGIYIHEFVESIIFTTGEVLRCKQALILDSENTYLPDSRLIPAFCRFSNIYFDSAKENSLIRRSKMCVFEGCWWENGWTSDGYNGLEIHLSHGLTFTNCHWYDNSKNGCFISTQSSDIIFNSCVFSNNNHSQSTNEVAGLYINDSQRVTVNSCLFSNNMGSSNATSKYAIYIAGGTNEYITIVNNQFDGFTKAIQNEKGDRKYVIVENNAGIEDSSEHLISQAFNNATSISLFLKKRGDVENRAGNSLLLFNANTSSIILILIPFNTNTVTCTTINGTITMTGTFDTDSNKMILTPSATLWGQTIIMRM